MELKGLNIPAKDTPSTTPDTEAYQSSGIAISQFVTFCLNEYSDAFLSLASNHSVASKDPAIEVRLDRGRLNVFQHFEKLLGELKRGKISIPAGDPVLGISCRNVLANFRCGAWVKGFTPSFLTVEDEDPSRSERPFHFLAFRNGRFTIDEAFPERAYLDECNWALSGVPIYWDGEDIADRMLAEMTDFSHLFKLPRGGDPTATPESIERWKDLRELAKRCLYLPRAEAAMKFRELTTGLTEQDTYLHNCAGVTVDGKLIVMIANASLTEIAAKLAALGARRAIVLDNGGSSSVFYFRNTDVNSGVQLLAGPNFRPAGTAYLFTVLKGDKYRSLRSFEL
jgi:hypothetical protein